MQHNKHFRHLLLSALTLLPLGGLFGLFPSLISFSSHKTWELTWHDSFKKLQDTISVHDNPLSYTLDTVQT